MRVRAKKQQAAMGREAASRRSNEDYLWMTKAGSAVQSCGRGIGEGVRDMVFDNGEGTVSTQVNKIQACPHQILILRVVLARRCLGRVSSRRRILFLHRIDIAKIHTARHVARSVAGRVLQRGTTSRGGELARRIPIHGDEHSSADHGPHPGLSV